MTAVDDLGLGVLGLAIALRDLQQQFELDRIAATRKLPEGHEITMRWSGDELRLEREDGHQVLVDPTRLEWVR